MIQTSRRELPGWLRCMAAAIIATVVTLVASAASAQTLHLGDFLSDIAPQEIFPGADRYGPVEGTPPAAPVFKGGEVVGYVWLNADVVNATGYSGKPIYVVVAMDLSGRIAGTRLVKHHEPIVLIGIPEAKIRNFVQGYVGFDIVKADSIDRTEPPVDIVSGATVSVLVIGDTITRSAKAIARSRGIGGLTSAAVPAGPGKVVDPDQQGSKSWEELLGEGAIRRLHLTVGEVNQAFERAYPGVRPEVGAPDDTVIDLYVALASAPVIGRSLLGAHEYQNLQRRLKPGQQAILVMGEGSYSWRGSGYVRGGIFDRITVQQADTIRFRDRHYKRIADIEAEEAPEFPEIGLFEIPKEAKFNAAQPWSLQLLVQRAAGAMKRDFLTYELSYDLPDAYLKTAPAPAPAAPAAAPKMVSKGATAPQTVSADVPLWQHIWQNRSFDVVVTGTGLFILTVIFYFQDWLVRRPRLHFWVRTTFLSWTLFWLGWYALAQLSVVNILTLTNSLITGFSWDYFLMDPLLFLLWAAVAASLIFWGRGAFCGWLCPFGALQELSNRLARLARIPQARVPWGLHERLWTIKYIIFLGLFGIGLYDLAFAERLAEVEPFKTAIVLHFMREWPYVVFALTLLAAGLFIERFFCRYLCPLGAGLAIPAKIRTFEWLKRHHECGRPCQRCAVECPVDSIHPDGRIDANECIYCMHCQVLYWHEHKCPAMIQRRLKRERAEALSSKGKTRPAMSAANPATWERPDAAANASASPLQNQ